MKNRRNYYRIIQVQPDAPVEVIRASYRTLMRELKQHPDIGGELRNAVILNEAYETLSDSKKRAEYDKILFEHYTKKPFYEASFNKKPLISLFCPFCKRPLARKAKPYESCLTCKSPLRSKSEEALYEDCRRSVVRIKKSGTLRYYSSWPQKGEEAEMVDLSPKGMRFICSEQLKQNLIIKLSNPLLKAVAKVITSQKKEPDGKNVYIVGVQFLTVILEEPKGSFISTSV